MGTDGRTAGGVGGWRDGRLWVLSGASSVISISVGGVGDCWHDGRLGGVEATAEDGGRCVGGLSCRLLPYRFINRLINFLG